MYYRKMKAAQAEEEEIGPPLGTAEEMAIVLESLDKVWHYLENHLNRRGLNYKKEPKLTEQSPSLTV